VGEEKEWLEFHLKKQRQKRAIFLVPEYHGRIIGNASVRLYDKTWDHEAEINIDIAKDFRNIGLGSYLIRELIERTRKEIKPVPVRLLLGAMSENTRALKLYKELGFKKITVIPGMYHYKKRFIDEVIMVYDL
jgi:putative acetyltransferase